LGGVLREEQHEKIRHGTNIFQNSPASLPPSLPSGHKAKKLLPEKVENKGFGSATTKSSKTALSVSEIQKRLPKARVCYVSATGASTLENLA